MLPRISLPRLYVLDANYKDHKIRLAGIDAPERRQAYGLASRKHLASIVAGKQVTVEYDKRDRYGRIVGKVLLDGIDVCLEQVKVGFAWHYKKYQHERSTNDQRLYADAENRARQGRLELSCDLYSRRCFQGAHTHICIHCRSFLDVLVSLLAFPVALVEPPEAEVTVGNERAHAKLLCQR